MKTFIPPNANNPKVFVLNDCSDGDAKVRQLGELARYLECSPEFDGITDELSLGMTTVSLLKTFRGGKKGLILGNAAPREGTKENGSRFGYFRHEKVVGVLSLTPRILFLLAKLGIAESINVLDTEKATDFMINEGFVDPKDREAIIFSQFRSAMFTPAVGAYLLQKGDIPANRQAIQVDESLHGVVAVKDNFGNLKLTTTSLEIGRPKDGTLINTKIRKPWDKLPFYSQLARVPDKLAAITEGSSGIGEHFFLEVVIKGKGEDAATTMGLDVGSPVL